ncbi:MAG: hypothetical protein V7733_10690 [Paraglaciecola polaris]|uniref:hypothetical protein n=1 Tax=Paraglaciecola polaris TaxID=222814 RepID=UPI003001E2F6
MKPFNLVLAQGCFVFELQHYRLYSEKIEGMLEQEVELLKEDHTSRVKCLNEKEREVFFDNRYDDYWELENLFSVIQRKSILISVYSVLEINLNQLCRLYSKVIDSDIVLEDLGEKDNIKRAQIYLTKVARVDFPLEHNSWTEIKKIQQIRNKLVHDNGNIPSGNSKLVRYIKNNTSLELDDSNRVVIRRGYIEHCISIFSDFFQELLNRNTPKK